MARSFNGSSQYLEYASAIVTAVPLTLAAWFNSTNVAVSAGRVLGCYGTSADNRFSLNVAQSLVTAGSSSAGVSNNANATAAPTSNVWQHAAAVFTSSTLRAAYLNGGSKGTNTTSSTPGTLNNTFIGAGTSGSATVVSFFPGLIAETCIWNAALSDQEVAALALGIRPTRIRPLSIVGYWPLWGFNSPETDYSGNANGMVLTAAPPAANHAPVTPFTRKAPALAYPSHLPPANYGIAPVAQPGILHGGRM